MNRLTIMCLTLSIAFAAPAPAQQPLTPVAVDVNKKMVKVFGASIREEDVPQIVEYLTKYYAN